LLHRVAIILTTEQPMLGWMRPLLHVRMAQA